MEVIELEIYTFEELDEQARENARAWYRDGLDYPWFSESIDSIRAFADHFGVTLKDWSLGSGCGRDYIHTDATNGNFRGIKLSDIDRESTPTGYCLDSDLWYEFYDQFKRTGDAKYSFEQALEAAICAIQRDIDYFYSDESVNDHLTINNYKFTKEGRVWE